MVSLPMMLGLLALSPCYPQTGILLGGQEVPREKFLVFLFIGHSNMAGRDIHRSDNVTHPRAWNYRWMSDKQWVLAKEEPGALKNGLSGRGNGGGGMPLLKRLVAEFPGYHIGAIDNASLSATVRYSYEPNTSGMPGDDNRYSKGSLLFREITAAAKEVRRHAVLGGIFCQLGIVEAVLSPEEICRGFSDDVAQMVKDLRAEIGEPNLPFLLGKYEAGATGMYLPTLPYPKIVAEQILLVPDKLPFSAVVESEGLEMLDTHHYTAGKGHVEWARRAVELYRARRYFPAEAISINPFVNRRTYANGLRKRNAPTFMSRQGLVSISWEDSRFLVDGKAWEQAPWRLE